MRSKTLVFVFSSGRGICLEVICARHHHGADGVGHGRDGEVRQVHDCLLEGDRSWPRAGARASWPRSRPSWRRRARRHPARRRTRSRLACPRPGRQIAGDWRRARAARSARGSRPVGREGSLFLSITGKSFTRSKKNWPQRRRLGPPVSIACAKAAQWKPDSANRAGCHRSHRLPAASCHATREADPIWNSPISRYIRSPQWHRPCINMGIAHFPRGHAIPCGWLGRGGFSR